VKGSGGGPGSEKLTHFNIDSALRVPIDSLVIDLKRGRFSGARAYRLSRAETPVESVEGGSVEALDGADVGGLNDRIIVERDKKKETQRDGDSTPEPQLRPAAPAGLPPAKAVGIKGRLVIVFRLLDSQQSEEAASTARDKASRKQPSKPAASPSLPPEAKPAE
jgi:hypothetical protein